jgi:cytochrome c oxidase assembly protein subunit 15
MSEAVASANPLVPAKGAAMVRAWLMVIAGMVYATILVGGATRLTDSGLSITEWRPLLGAIPPLNDADWADAFAKYQAMTAQYHQMNPDMDLAGFKAMYWWEWAHRELGRAIGVAFVLPLAFFWFTGRTTRKLLPHLLILFALGGLQGLVGWWMVASGVNTELTSVAPYRLMFHFSLALFIIAYCFWLWLELGATRRPLPAAAGGWATALIWTTGVQMALGALVAGLDAGRGYVDWPLMNGKFVPDNLWALEPVWRNFAENEATVQFLHRMVAYLLLALSLAAAWRMRTGGLTLFPLLAALVSAQALLGVWTLVNAAPLGLSLLHQALGVIVLMSATRLVWASKAK